MCAEGPKQEFWLELKANDDPSPIIRPEQAAWITRRVHCGGRVFVLHRRKGLPWFLYDGRKLRLSPSGRVESPHDFTGYTGELLATSILSLL